jgi:hypothetical protein
MAEDIFIDAEQPFGKDENKYDEIVINQIRRCVDNLSKEIKGGVMVVTTNRNGEKHEYVEDVREVTVNSIWTLKVLMAPFLKDPFNKDIQKIEEEIVSYSKDMAKRKQMIRGRGEVTLQELYFIEPNHPEWRKFMDFKLYKYKAMFKILVEAYNKYKRDIMAMSEE